MTLVYSVDCLFHDIKSCDFMTSSHVIIPTVTTRHVNFADPFFCVSLSLLPWLWLTLQHRLRHVKSLLVRNLTLPDIYSSYDALSISVYFTLHSTHNPDKGSCFTEMTLINFELHIHWPAVKWTRGRSYHLLSLQYGGCFLFPWLHPYGHHCWCHTIDT